MTLTEEIMQEIQVYRLYHSFLFLEASRYVLRKRGYSYEEIGELTQASASAVKQYLTRLDKKLIEKPYFYTNLDELMS